MLIKTHSIIFYEKNTWSPFTLLFKISQNDQVRVHAFPVCADNFICSDNAHISVFKIHLPPLDRNTCICLSVCLRHFLDISAYRRR